MGRTGEDQTSGIETMNLYLVSSGVSHEGKENIVIMLMPQTRTFTKDQALNLAAWLVVLADDGPEPKFGKLLREVMNT